MGKVFKTIIAGSYAYGTPTTNSDVDLVILVDPATAAVLSNLADNGSDLLGSVQCPRKPADDPEVADTYGCGVPLRFGKLNLIVNTDIDEFMTWVNGTTYLEANYPVTRDQAVAEFKARRAELWNKRANGS